MPHPTKKIKDKKYFSNHSDMCNVLFSSLISTSISAQFRKTHFVQSCCPCKVAKDLDRDQF